MISGNTDETRAFNGYISHHAVIVIHKPEFNYTGIISTTDILMKAWRYTW
jgi:hypothetical protein